MSLNDEIKKILLNNKPNISESTIKAYTGIIKKLYKDNNDNEKDFDPLFFHQQLNIIQKLKDVKPRYRKTILSALITFNGSEKTNLYKQLMNKDADECSTFDKSGEKSEKQKENWITQEELKKKYDELLNKNKSLLKTNDELTNPEYQSLQNLIIVALFYLNEPRRAKDYCDMKIKNIDKNLNYIKNNNFIFNSYKTAKYTGQEIVPINKELKFLLNKFIKKSPYEWLLNDSNGEKINNVQLNQRFNKIFEKKVSVNIFRHSYLSEKYKNMPELNDMIKTAQNMGHSLEQALEYVKK
jgi:integrase